MLISGEIIPLTFRGFIFKFLPSAWISPESRKKTSCKEARLHSRFEHCVHKFQLSFGYEYDFFEKTSFQLVLKVLNSTSKIVSIRFLLTYIDLYSMGMPSITNWLMFRGGSGSWSALADLVLLCLQTVSSAYTPILWVQYLYS